MRLFALSTLRKLGAAIVAKPKPTPEVPEVFAAGFSAPKDDKVSMFAMGDNCVVTLHIPAKTSYRIKSVVFYGAKELVALRELITKDEADKLDPRTLNSHQTSTCIYGQMTSHCRSARAQELMALCVYRLYSTVGLLNPGVEFDATKLEDKGRRNGISHYTAFELLLMTILNVDFPALISFLKKETNSLVLTLETYDLGYSFREGTDSPDEVPTAPTELEVVNTKEAHEEIVKEIEQLSRDFKDVVDNTEPGFKVFISDDTVVVEQFPLTHSVKFLKTSKYSDEERFVLIEGAKEMLKLRSELTIAEANLLDGMLLKPHSYHDCVYGQATGHCRSDRALELQAKCATFVGKHGKSKRLLVGMDDPQAMDGTTELLIRREGSERLVSKVTAFEILLFSYDRESLSAIADFLKKKRASLILDAPAPFSEEERIREDSVEPTIQQSEERDSNDVTTFHTNFGDWQVAIKLDMSNRESLQSSFRDYLNMAAKELVSIRRFATDEQRERLNATILNGNDADKCVYGQMTGNCRSEAAIELIGLCTETVIGNYYFVNSIDSEGYRNTIRLNRYTKDLEKSVIKKGQRSTAELTPFEVFLMGLKQPQKENLVEFLKGKVDFFNLDLEKLQKI